MKFLLLIGILGYVAVSCESALIGQRECSFGPAYWCHSIRNAKNCNAVPHCIQTVWEKQTLPIDNDGVCQICVDMVRQARDVLQSNDTQEMIRQVFEGSCAFIPIKVVRKECDNLVDEFIPELIETLSSEMNPQVVCATAGLCNSVAVDRLIKEYIETQPDFARFELHKDTCSDCHTFLQDLSDAVKSHSQSVVMNHLLAICGRLSSLSDGCRMLIQNNFYDIYNFIAFQMDQDQICNLFGLCGSFLRQSTVSTAVTKTGTDIPCEFCEDIIKHWKENLSSNTTEEQFREILNGICQHTGSYKKECMGLVEEYYLPVYSVLVSEIEPEEICGYVGLCGVASVFKVEVPIWILDNTRGVEHLELEGSDNDIMTNMIGGDEVNSYKKGRFVGNDEANAYKRGRFVGNDEANAYKKGRFVGNDEANAYKNVESIPWTKLNKVSVNSHGTNGVLKTNSDACVMCEFVFHYLQDLLQDKNSRKLVKDDLKEACGLMPRSVREECDDYVDAYADEIIQLFIHDIDPAQMCSLLGLCPGKRVTGTEDTSCVLCEYAMTQLEDVLKDNKTEASIQNALDSLCSIMPKSIRSDCVTFIDQYTDQIIQLLIADFTPNQICYQLGLCKDSLLSETLPTNPNLLSEVSRTKIQLPIDRMFSHGFAKNKSVPVKPDNIFDQPIQCVFCEFVMYRLHSFLVTKKTEAEIEAELNKMCMLFPNTLMHDCIGFVEDYGDALVEMISKNISPQQVCRELKLCHARSFTDDMPKAILRRPVNKCKSCQKIVGAIDAGSKNEEDIAPDVHIMKILNDICPTFTDEARDQCIEIGSNYGPYIKKLVTILHTNHKVCQALKDCALDHSDAKRALVGTTECTWGPDYWCQSEDNAKGCGAMEHCTEHVWGKEEKKAGDNQV